MDKSFSKRKSGKFLAAAIAATMGAAGLTQQADASLLIDVRASGAVTGGGTITTGGKTVTLAAGVPVTVTMGVFARVSGANSVQQVGDFGGGGSDDVRNDDFVQTVVGSFNSVGGLLGNLTTGAAGAQVAPNPRTIPFGDNGSTNGIASDWDSDGDLDIGLAPPGTNPATMFAARTGSAATATIAGPTASNNAPGTKGWSTISGISGNNANDTIINATTSEIQIGSLRFVTSGLGGPATNVNFIPRPTGDAGQAIWFEDGSPAASTPANGVFLLGTPVNVVVPEPSTLALATLAGLGLLARRRKEEDNA
jgi:hypothetical protein